MNRENKTYPPDRLKWSVSLLLLLGLLAISCNGKNPADPSEEIPDGLNLKPTVSSVVNIDGPFDGPANHPPDTFSLCSPQDDSMFCMCDSDQHINFVWTSSTDPDGDTVSYTWFLIEAEENRVLLSQETGQDTSFVLNESVISAVFPTDCTIHHASWEVRATDGRSAVFSPEHEVAVLNQPEMSSALPWSFPQDFSAPHDQLTGHVLGGWGGCSGCVTHTPVVFLHGNYDHANTWRTVAQRFLDNGYVPRELWALTYLDFSGGDSANSNMANVDDIDQFISAVLDYTGADKVDLIAHSLGVTVSRTWMKERNAYDRIGHFIGIAGPNHGVNFCFNPSINFSLCQELGHPHSDFLTYLNDPDETPEDAIVSYMTIYDGTVADYFYLQYAVFNDGSSGDLRESPCLEGATNIQLPGKDHMALKDCLESFNHMFTFLTSDGMYVQY